jgi:hypothetical protein
MQTEQELYRKVKKEKMTIEKFYKRWVGNQRKLVYKWI